MINTWFKSAVLIYIYPSVCLVVQLPGNSITFKKSFLNTYFILIQAPCKNTLSEIKVSSRLQYTFLNKEVYTYLLFLLFVFTQVTDVPQAYSRCSGKIS